MHRSECLRYLLEWETFFSGENEVSYLGHVKQWAIFLPTQTGSNAGRIYTATELVCSKPVNLTMLPPMGSTPRVGSVILYRVTAKHRKIADSLRKHPTQAQKTWFPLFSSSTLILFLFYPLSAWYTWRDVIGLWRLVELFSWFVWLRWRSKQVRRRKQVYTWSNAGPKNWRPWFSAGNW